MRMRPPVRRAAVTGASGSESFQMRRSPETAATPWSARIGESVGTVRVAGGVGGARRTHRACGRNALAIPGGPVNANSRVVAIWAAVLVGTRLAGSHLSVGPSRGLY